MATGLSFIQYDPNASAATNSANMTNNQNQSYQSFMTNLPDYQNNMNNQAIDQGAKSYNNAKDQIDTQANKRGLLYSGMKQGAEAGAANQAADATQKQIAGNNENLSNLATNYGNQLAGTNIQNYEGEVQGAMDQYKNNLSQYSQNQQMLGGLLGGVGSMAALAFSDKNLKEDISDGDKDANDMVSNIKPSKFKYKDDPKHEERLGIMAQDLEKSPMGKSLVIETPKGKAIDTMKALAAVMAVQGALDKRLKKAGA